jgi:long-subunit acyl-CoA synthetase (AMP-forming)
MDNSNYLFIYLAMFDWAMKCAQRNINSKFQGDPYEDLEFKLAKTLILNKIHRELGLDKCRNLYSGAAPISRKTLDFFINIGLPLCEGSYP